MRDQAEEDQQRRPSRKNDGSGHFQNAPPSAPFQAGAADHTMKSPKTKKCTSGSRAHKRHSRQAARGFVQHAG
eukprot:253639-Prorocentrum_lima.AAC.1